MYLRNIFYSAAATVRNNSSEPHSTSHAIGHGRRCTRGAWNSGVLIAIGAIGQHNFGDRSGRFRRDCFYFRSRAATAARFSTDDWAEKGTAGSVLLLRNLHVAGSLLARGLQFVVDGTSAAEGERGRVRVV
jgi:hypothetical protein